MVSEYYTPSHESGIRWNDPAFNIEWPQKNGLLISNKDKSWPTFQAEKDSIQLGEEKSNS